MPETLLLVGDVRTALSLLDDESIQCVVTSPPYWGLRDYGHAGQLGLEATPEEYVANLVQVFREVRRVLRGDGTLWLNLGDSYTSGGRTWRSEDKKHPGARGMSYRASTPDSLKPKDLVGIPWRVAFALQADGWYLRSDIIWHKPNVMPESVTDRPTRSHEYLFLLTKSLKYYYDSAALKEPAKGAPGTVRKDQAREFRTPEFQSNRRGRSQEPVKVGAMGIPADGLRNARSVWTFPTRPYRGAHFAVFPPELPTRCIKAGSRVGDTVLDPFGGSGTTGAVAYDLGRHSVLVELNPEYAALAQARVPGAEILPISADETGTGLLEADGA